MGGRRDQREADASCESNIQVYVGSQAQATAPADTSGTCSDSDHQRQLVGWVNLLRKGRRRLCWVETGSLPP